MLYFHNFEKALAAPNCMYCSMHGKYCNYLCTYNAPMVYTAPCIMFWMRAYPLRGEVGGVGPWNSGVVLGPVKWHRTDRQVPLCTGLYNHRCIGCFMHTSPLVTLTGFRRESRAHTVGGGRAGE